MKTCNDCVYWRREEPLPEYLRRQTCGAAVARCGITCPPRYTLAGREACEDFAVEDSFVEAVIRA